MMIGKNQRSTLDPMICSILFYTSNIACPYVSSVTAEISNISIVHF